VCLLSPVSCRAGDERLVVRVIDGDTILLDGDERVRLIGVDTPESVHPRRAVESFAREAAAYVTKRVRGRRVTLEFDGNTAKRDRWGRTLAYVRLEDGSSLNLDIIADGCG